jgi:hypothetical protein
MIRWNVSDCTGYDILLFIVQAVTLDMKHLHAKNKTNPFTNLLTAIPQVLIIIIIEFILLLRVPSLQHISMHYVVWQLLQCRVSKLAVPYGIVMLLCMRYD